jgi:hypothetical protein
MHAARVLGFVLVGMLIIDTGWAVASSGAGWLATGTVMKTDANTVYFLGHDNVVYTIDTTSARILSNAGGLSVRPRAGDQVRIYGRLTRSGDVRASRVRVLSSAAGRSAFVGNGPTKEVCIVVEKESDQAESEPAVVPEAPCAPKLPNPEAPSATWQGKGLISDIDYVGHQVKIQTSDGSFTVDVDGATMVRGTVRVGLSRLNQGDAIWVAGNEVAPYVIAAQMIRVLRSGSEAMNAVPMMPTSVVGVIQQIDYPSRTFKMSGRVTVAVVSCDDNTVIQFMQTKQTFLDLKPGTRINMSGYGNLTSGYAAQHIQIIAVSP